MVSEGATVLSDLAQSPISETLRRLSAQRLSGDLQIRSGKTTKIGGEAPKAAAAPAAPAMAPAMAPKK